MRCDPGHHAIGALLPILAAQAAAAAKRRFVRYDYRGGFSARRNGGCPCGSGRKYKHCCQRKLEAEGKIYLVGARPK